MNDKCTSITPERIVEHGIRELRGNDGMTGTWCIHCNCFIGEHSYWCPYAALEATLNAHASTRRDYDGLESAQVMLEDEYLDVRSRCSALEAEVASLTEKVAELFAAKEYADETGLYERYETAWNNLRTLLESKP